MNLHNIAFPLTNAALWLTAYGRNGRGIGDHLWVVAEGEPPEFSTTGRGAYNVRYWTPQRFAWRPFNFNMMFAGGFVPSAVWPTLPEHPTTHRPDVGATHRANDVLKSPTSAVSFRSPTHKHKQNQPYSKP